MKLKESQVRKLCRIGQRMLDGGQPIEAVEAALKALTHDEQGSIVARLIEEFVDQAMGRLDERIEAATGMDLPKEMGERAERVADALAAEAVRRLREGLPEERRPLTLRGYLALIRSRQRVEPQIEG